MDIRQSRDWVTRNKNILFFVGGFLFDALTLTRIDSIIDLLIQCGYLACITAILIQQVRVETGAWQPSGRIAKLWEYETEAIHFFYGGLLSAYVILYFKSTTGPHSTIFMVLVVLLMIANEMPQLKAAGFRMRLGLHAFCVVSFLNYLVPVLVGKMGAWTFLIAVAFTAAISAWLVKKLARLMPQMTRARWRLGWPPALALTIVTALYFMKWIPPVPLSMPYAGVFHNVVRDGDKYQLSYPKPAWYVFWRKESSPFLARPNDTVHGFVRVFAPRRFSQEIYMQWSVQDPVSKKYTVADRLPLVILGGRGEGFRGHGTKSNYAPGTWRVEIVTGDGRVVGRKEFEIKQDTATEPRTFLSRWM